MIALHAYIILHVNLDITFMPLIPFLFHLLPHPLFCFARLLSERDARHVTWLQHGKLQILQEPLEDVRGASHFFSAGPARTSSEELLLALLQLRIKVPLLVRESCITEAEFLVL